MIKEEETARLAPGWYNKTISTEIICEKVKIIKCEITTICAISRCFKIEKGNKTFCQ